MYIRDCASFLPSVQYIELQRFETFLRENVSQRIYDQRKYTVFLLVLVALTAISYYHGGNAAIQMYVWINGKDKPTSPEVIWLLFKAGSSVGLMTFAFAGFFASGLMKDKVRGTTIYINSLNASLSMFNLSFCADKHQLKFCFTHKKKPLSSGTSNGQVRVLTSTHSQRKNSQNKKYVLASSSAGDGSSRSPTGHGNSDRKASDMKSAPKSPESGVRMGQPDKSATQRRRPYSQQ